MSESALCSDTADPETFVDLHQVYRGVSARPRHHLVKAVRYQEVSRSFRSTHPWVEKAKLTLLLLGDGRIYYQLNYVFTMEYGGRETRNPWKHLKSLKEINYHAVATIAREWDVQGYMVVVAAVKRIKAELAVRALAEFGRGF